ncbi:MAG: hypothetical protein Q8P20_07985 [bacterium]|nr:hypothetical protein [bacterium]MDZ4227880.1 hypothetical protein [Candidatus Levybacteria bacterium]
MSKSKRTFKYQRKVIAFSSGMAVTLPKEICDADDICAGDTLLIEARNFRNYKLKLIKNKK